MDAINCCLYEGATREGRRLDNIHPSGLIPLYASLHHGHVDIVQLLLKEGTESCREDNLGRSLSFFAVQGGLEALNVLRDREININKRDYYGSTLLSVAVRYSYKELVNQLLAIPEIDCTLKDNFGRSALWWARKQGHVGIEECLLDYAKNQGVDFGTLEVETGELVELNNGSGWCDIVTVATSLFAWNAGGLERIV
ncbi:hypothetical protein PG994_010109 [Apiospora phragmitis]|uniref:Ankyrin n=1 Tax=Apiospora phragmitis TaxID=2905665 RepID=A0ABR1TRI9_9PEZI